MGNPNIDELIRQTYQQLQQGHSTQARQLIQEVRLLVEKRYTKNANAWIALSALYGMLEDFKESENCAQRGVKLQPNSIQGWYNYGNALQSQGRTEECVDKFRRAIAAGAVNQAQVHLNLALALHSLNRTREAEEHYRKAAALDSASLNPRLRLALFLLDTHKPAEASHILQTLAVKNPTDLSVLVNLGRALLDSGRWNEAFDACDKALQLNPNSEEVYLLQGSINMFLGRFKKAEDSFKKMLAINPTRPEAMLGIAEAYWQLGGLRKEAMEYCRKALALNNNYLPAWLSLCTNLVTQGDIDEAHLNIKQVLQRTPENITAIGILGTILHRKGLYEDALKLLLPYVEKQTLDVNIATAFADIAKRFNLQLQAITYIENYLKDANLPSGIKRTLRFTLGNLYDAIANYDLAFENYHQANALKEAAHDIEAYRRDIDGMIGFFTKERMENLPRSNVPSELPIFVLGMPRSGTSLVEQILARHSLIYGAGELNEVTEIARLLSQRYKDYTVFAQSISKAELNSLAADYLDFLRKKNNNAQRVVDKMPGNYFYLALISMLFPDARVIHCTRDARDTCLSEYFQDFGGNLSYTYDLTTVGATYVQYQRLMDHWEKVLDIRILEVNYEELVKDQESVSRKMIEFCGLEWEENCLRFYESNRQVATRSYDQVRRPMYNSSVGKWKHYVKHLGPLFKALDNEILS